MTDPRPVQAGSEWQPRTGDHNAFVGAWQYVQSKLRSGGAGLGRNKWGTGIVSMRNSSGADRDRFDVLGIQAPTITPGENLAQFQRQICLDGVKPTLGHMGRFAVLLEPVKAGRITQWAMVAGVTVAKVDFTKGPSDHADVFPGEAGKLWAIDSGPATILWPAPGDGSGVQWSVVSLGGSMGEVAIQLAEAHPGRGKDFKVWLGWWDPGDDAFDYDQKTEYWAVDWRNEVPEPAKCATGWATWKPSKAEGQILHVDDLDCVAPSCEEYH